MQQIISKTFPNLDRFDLASLIGFLTLLMGISQTLPSKAVLIVCALGLGISIYSAVHHAEVIAKKVGPSFGTLVLALAVTIIEVALIVSLMKTSPEKAPTIARDTIFSAVMIVTNGIMGACIIAGGVRFKELTFKTTGTSALISVLLVLSILTFVLPNTTTSAPGPQYTHAQLVFVSVFSIILYSALVIAQTKTHRSYFEVKEDSQSHSSQPSSVRVALSFASMLASLIAVVGLAKVLSPTIERFIADVGAPQTVVGIIIALLVLAPESLAAIKSAKMNQLQTSLNLALGSGAASIALTIPVVSAYAIITDQKLLLGIDAKSMVFLMLTFLAAGLTCSIGRSTFLHGVVHLVIMASYLAMTFLP